MNRKPQSVLTGGFCTSGSKGEFTLFRGKLSYFGFPIRSLRKQCQLVQASDSRYVLSAVKIGRPFPR